MALSTMFQRNALKLSSRWYKTKCILGGKKDKGHTTIKRPTVCKMYLFEGVIPPTLQYGQVQLARIRRFLNLNPLFFLMNSCDDLLYHLMQLPYLLP